MTEGYAIANSPTLNAEVRARLQTAGIPITGACPAPQGNGEAVQVDISKVGQAGLERAVGDIARVFTPMAIRLPVRFDVVDDARERQRQADEDGTTEYARRERVVEMAAYRRKR